MYTCDPLVPVFFMFASPNWIKHKLLIYPSLNFNSPQLNLETTIFHNLYSWNEFFSTFVANTNVNLITYFAWILKFTNVYKFQLVFKVVEPTKIWSAFGAIRGLTNVRPVVDVNCEKHNAVWALFEKYPLL